MSTPELQDLLSSGPPKGDPVIGGIRLRRYVAIHAALSEGFPLDTALRHEGIDPLAWPDIDGVWADAMLESVDGDRVLIDLYEAAFQEAQERFRRPIAPIDEDLVAWLDFLRAWQSAPDPSDFVRQSGLVQNDLIRLHRSWSEKIGLDGALQRRAAEILERPAALPPPLQIGPATLPPPLGDRPVVAPAEVDDDDDGDDKAAPPAPRRPSLMRPLPPTSAADGARPSPVATPAAPREPPALKARVPIGPPLEVPASALPPPVTIEKQLPSFMRAAAPAAVEIQPPVGDDVERAQEPQPSQDAPVFMKHELGWAPALTTPSPPAGAPAPAVSAPAARPDDTVAFAAPLPLPPVPFVGKSDDREAFARAMAAGTGPRPGSSGTPQIDVTGDLPADLVRRIAEGRLPFARSAATPPSPAQARPQDEPSTLAAQPSPLAGSALPFSKDKRETPERAHSTGPTDVPRESPAVRSAPPHAGTPAGGKGAPPEETLDDRTLEPAPSPIKAALPFHRPARKERPAMPPVPPAGSSSFAPRQQSTAPAPSAPSSAVPMTDLTLEQYASMCAELAVFPDRSEAVFAKYGLADGRRRAAVDAAWKQRLSRYPSERAEWERRYLQYEASWRRSRR